MFFWLTKVPFHFPNAFLKFLNSWYIKFFVRGCRYFGPVQSISFKNSRDPESKKTLFFTFRRDGLVFQEDYSFNTEDISMEGHRVTLTQIEDEDEF